MRTFLALGTLLFAGIPLTAQIFAPAGTSAESKAKAALAQAVVMGQNCPVALDASRDPDGGLVQTSPANRHREQGLRLYFTPTDPHGIAQADFTVHGMVGAQVIPAGEHSQRHATEDFHVSPSSGENHRFTSTVYMKRLTGIDYVELSAITFADGTQWHSSAASTCRVTPNGFKLVASSN